MHLSDEKIQKLLFILILILGIGARLWMYGDVPGGINQDEAFAAREAWSLLHYGKDSFGYSCPMYLTAWGSGMNALNTYLMMPFIALFGMHTWVFRLPQMLIGILSLFAIEEIVSKVADWKCSLLAMFPLGTGKQSGRWLSAVWTTILYLWNGKAALFHFVCHILWSEPILLCCCMADRSHHNSDAGIVPFICTQNKDYKIYYNCNFDFYCIYHSRHSFLSR